MLGKGDYSSCFYMPQGHSNVDEITGNSKELGNKEYSSTWAACSALHQYWTVEGQCNRTTCKSQSLPIHLSSL
eukprot:8842604-Ditylum_brightwellii.AAC.1